MFGNLSVLTLVIIEERDRHSWTNTVLCLGGWGPKELTEFEISEADHVH